jgi:hypothetical protein
MTDVQMIVTAACGGGGLVLSLGGAYWLGWRDAVRTVVHEQMDVALERILDEADEDDDGGLRVLA